MLYLAQSRNIANRCSVRLQNRKGRWKWTASCSNALIPGKELVSIGQESGWAPGLVWNCCSREDLVPAENHARLSGLWLNLDASASPAQTLSFVGDKQNTLVLSSSYDLLQISASAAS
jgi:hypothetical protein